MKRRDFMGLAAAATVGFRAFAQAAGAAAKGKAITEKDILKEGQPAVIANYCENPAKNAKACPMWKDKPGECKTCMFFNKDGSLTTFKGKTYARCQLLADPAKPQFVHNEGYCATYVKQG